MKFSLLILLLYSSSLWAQALDNFTRSNIDPLRTIDEVSRSKVIEEVIHLDGAKVVIADYDLLKKDFPHLSYLSHDEIDQWLLRETAFISKGQQAQSVVNSQIAPSNFLRKAWRPDEYGRALVYEVSDVSHKTVGLIDVKGAGGIKPSHASHNSGTATLGEALREFSYEKMVTTVVTHTGIENKVVGSYAVISAGFDVIHEDGSRSAAGLYLRQGHRRLTAKETQSTLQPRGNGWMKANERKMFNNLLTRYGIFANENFQGTINNDLFDFGHYIIREDLPGLDPKLSVPFEKWGFDLAQGEEVATSGEGRWKMSKMDRPWRWSHDVADAFAAGKITRHDVWMHHFHLVNPVQEKLQSTPRIFEVSEKLGFKVDICSGMYRPWGRITK